MSVLTYILQLKDIIQVVEHFHGHVKAVRKGDYLLLFIHLKEEICVHSLVINVIPSDGLQLPPLQRHVGWYSGIPLMELDLGDQEFSVLFNARTIAILQVTPELPHLRKHRSVSHRVLAAQVVALAEHFMEEMAELPGRDAILQEGLPDRDCPEGMRTLAMEGADDRCSGMFHFQRDLLRTQRFTYADRLRKGKVGMGIVIVYFIVLDWGGENF